MIHGLRSSTESTTRRSWRRSASSYSGWLKNSRSRLRKWLLSLAVDASLVGVRPRDLFGFGYLLSSLLAMRMLQRKSARAVLLPTLATALAGWLLGSALGFGFGLVAPVPALAPGGPQATSQRLLRSPLGALALARVQAEMAPAEGPSRAQVLPLLRGGLAVLLLLPHQALYERVSLGQRELGVRHR